MNFSKTPGCTFAACALAATLGACGSGVFAALLFDIATLSTPAAALQPPPDDGADPGADDPRDPLVTDR